MHDEPEKPRGFLFHWLANIFFAGIALYGGVLFGLEVPADWAVPIVILGALVLIPVTRRWERAGISKRQAQAAEAREDAPPEESA